MSATLLFRELVRLPTSEWTTERLGLLPVKELAELCQLVGIPYSGTKHELANRLLDQTELQRCIRPYWTTLEMHVTVAQIEALADACLGRELKLMCRRAGCYAGSTKYAMAASLIGWNRQCFRRGQEFYLVALEGSKRRPVRQLVLPL